MDEFSAGYAGFCDEAAADLSAGRFAAAAAKAHGLKGVAANLGADDLARAAQGLEEAAQRQDRRAGREILAELAALLDPILAAIRFSGPAPGNDTAAWDNL